MTTMMANSAGPAQDARDQDATAVEYSLLAALVAAVVSVAVAALGIEMLGLFTSLLDIWP